MVSIYSNLKQYSIFKFNDKRTTLNRTVSFITTFSPFIDRKWSNLIDTFGKNSLKFTKELMSEKLMQILKFAELMCNPRIHVYCWNYLHRALFYILVKLALKYKQTKRILYNNKCMLYFLPIRIYFQVKFALYCLLK